MKLYDIHLRDPFILPYDGKYYLYGSPGQYAWEGQNGFWCYVSSDLEEWSEPVQCFEKPADFWSDDNYWAPEVHVYKDRFYLFASFHVKDKSRNRSVQILVSDSPLGPFVPMDEPATPADWMCLDGTLYVEDGTPYLIFCHEWVQVKDGEMCLQQLSDDLSRPIGEPTVLFRASEPSWACDGPGGYVTDGPFLYKAAQGKLLMIWSSFNDKGYVEAVAVSDSGSIRGPWRQCDALFSDQNGGHGMLFRAFDGMLYFTLHSPNQPWGAERPHLMRVKEIAEEPYLAIEEERE